MAGLRTRELIAYDQPAAPRVKKGPRSLDPALPREVIKVPAPDLELTRLEGLSYREAGRQMGVTEATIDAHVRPR